MKERSQPINCSRRPATTPDPTDMTPQITLVPTRERSVSITLPLPSSGAPRAGIDWTTL